MFAFPPEFYVYALLLIFIETIQTAWNKQPMKKAILLTLFVVLALAFLAFYLLIWRGLNIVYFDPWEQEIELFFDGEPVEVLVFPWGAMFLSDFEGGVAIVCAGETSDSDLVGTVYVTRHLSTQTNIEPTDCLNSSGA